MENINETYHAMAFFDLDGTLLNQNSQIDDEVAHALHQIRQNGILPIIATGRGHFELDAIMAKSGITSAIAMNGQFIVVEGETIYHEAMPVAQIKQLKTASDAKNQALAFYDKDSYWVSQMTDLVRNAYAYTDAPLPSVDAERFLTNEVNMLLVFSDELSDVDHYRAQVPEFNYFMNTPYSIDTINASSNKGTGIKKVIELLGFTGETYGFGDGRNDLHLLGAVDHATAMGNAVPELKAMADFISTANTDHGIVNAFKHWHLL
ncbi:Cof-type HAD-IIB family hydrolase [Lactococcus insecticola]|uniref:Hydrolase n=1 Tax=Pseudolactococcus insecticola TaxID=2709158 RepID=A0A6A0B7M4_9LACT|nr:Cof-type HAD-IIB family hydrolase [Lactococcus insecticola]GFH39787.1 hydrolase [Lactococcus insecticola]